MIGGTPGQVEPSEGTSHDNDTRVSAPTTGSRSAPSDQRPDAGAGGAGRPRRRVESRRPGDPIPHPALDREPEAQGTDKDGLDKVVFGISAAVALAFVLWGIIGTSR